MFDVFAIDSLLGSQVYVPKECNMNLVQLLEVNESALDVEINQNTNNPSIKFNNEIFGLNDKLPNIFKRLIVRIFDIVGSASAIVILSPVMLFIAVVIKTTSKGPIIFKSKRLSRDRFGFDAYKFRSMRSDAETQLISLLEKNPKAKAEYTKYLKLENDPRITRIGNFLRKTSLDELPQLFNILTGEMSLVGPRPKLTIEEAFYGEALATVLRVKPGLTGLWQVSGRNDLTIDERVMMDVNYALNRNIISDIKICFKTASQMLKTSNNGAK